MEKPTLIFADQTSDQTNLIVRMLGMLNGGVQPCPPGVWVPSRKLIVARFVGAGGG